jgi:hypothetical protein
MLNRTDRFLGSDHRTWCRFWADDGLLGTYRSNRPSFLIGDDTSRMKSVRSSLRRLGSVSIATPPPVLS